MLQIGVGAQSSWFSTAFLDRTTDTLTVEAFVEASGLDFVSVFLAVEDFLGQCSQNFV